MQEFRGTWRLLRLALRRDRISLPLTIGLTLALIVGSVPALAEVYSSRSEITSYVASAAPSVVGRVFQGPVQGSMLGSIVVAELYLFGAVIICIMSAFIVTRHTRHNEEIGAAELIGSGVVGRSAPLSAALLLVVLANVVTSGGIYAGLLMVPELDAAGSLYLALAFGGFGLAMAGIAAVTAQLSDYRRGANLLAMAALGVFFLVRGFGDAIGELSADGLSVTSHWLSWLSPMGWGYLVLPYAENNLAPLALSLGLFLASISLAYALLYRRDVGSSIFASKPGSARASSWLRTIEGLASRLQRGNLLVWTAGFAVTGALVAVVVDDYRQTFEENEFFQTMLARTGQSADGFIEAIVGLMFPILATFLAGYAVSALVKLADEENSSRLEAILSTATGRVRWLLSHVGFAIFGSVVAFSVMGLAAGVGYAVSADDSTLDGMTIFWASVVSVPAMLVFVGVISLVFAAFGRWVKPFAWTYYAYCAFIGTFKGIFDWPEWVGKLSPFGYTPSYPSNDFEWTALVGLLVVATLLIAASCLVFRRRDITTE